MKILRQSVLAVAVACGGLSAMTHAHAAHFARQQDVSSIGMQYAPVSAPNTRMRVNATLKPTSGKYRNGQVVGGYWEVDGVKVSDGATYVLTNKDIGKTVFYVERVRNTQNNQVVNVKARGVFAVSLGYPSMHAAPAIAEAGKTVTPGTTLNGRMGKYNIGGQMAGEGFPAGRRFYQNTLWFAGGKQVGTGATYTVRPEDAGKDVHYEEHIINHTTGEVAVFASGKVTVATGNATPPTPTPPANTGNDICAGIVAKNHPLSKNRTADPLPDTPQLPLRQALEAPFYKTCLVRLTERQHDGNTIRNHYSRFQAFNADSSYMLLNAIHGGEWRLYNAQSGLPVRTLAGIGADAELSWHPSNPNVLYHLGQKGIGLGFYERDVRQDASRLVADFNQRIKARWPSANAASTKSEGSPSADGRYWCFLVEDAAWNVLGAFTWDRQTDKIIGMMDLNVAANHLSMSPSGRYCVISSDNAFGTRAYTADFSKHIQLLHKSEHSDIALNKNGQDVYVSINNQDDGGHIFMVNLDTGEKTNLLRTFVSGTATAVHFSGKAYRKPGWILVSTYGERNDHTGVWALRRDSSRQWFHRKVFAMSLEANPQIRVIGYADAGYVPEENKVAWNYWSEPHATVNRDFTRILFNSTWATSNPADIAAYMTVIGKDALDK